MRIIEAGARPSRTANTVATSSAIAIVAVLSEKFGLREIKWRSI